MKYVAVIGGYSRPHRAFPYFMREHSSRSDKNVVVSLLSWDSPFKIATLRILRINVKIRVNADSVTASPRKF